MIREIYHLVKQQWSIFIYISNKRLETTCRDKQAIIKNETEFIRLSFLSMSIHKIYWHTGQPLFLTLDCQHNLIITKYHLSCTQRNGKFYKKHWHFKLSERLLYLFYTSIDKVTSWIETHLLCTCNLLGNCPVTIIIVNNLLVYLLLLTTTKPANQDTQSSGHPIIRTLA